MGDYYRDYRTNSYGYGETSIRDNYASSPYRDRVDSLERRLDCFDRTGIERERERLRIERERFEREFACLNRNFEISRCRPTEIVYQARSHIAASYTTINSSNFINPIQQPKSVFLSTTTTIGTAELTVAAGAELGSFNFIGNFPLPGSSIGQTTYAAAITTSGLTPSALIAGVSGETVTIIVKFTNTTTTPIVFAAGAHVTLAVVVSYA